MTYPQAWRIAEQRNLDLQAVRLERGVRQASVTVAGLRPNPTTSAEFSRDQPHVSLLLEWPIELGGQRDKRVDLAQAELKLLDAEYANRVKMLRASLREAFYGLLLKEGQVQLAGRQLEIAKRATEAAEERFRLGAVAFLEVRQARLEESRARGRLALATQEIDASRIELAALLNLDDPTSLAVAGDLEEFPKPFDFDRFRQSALDENPEVQGLSRQLEVEERRARLLQAENLPELSAIGGSDFGSSDFAAGPRAGLTLEIPLVKKRAGEIQRTEALQNQLRVALEAARRRVAAAVEAATARLRAQRSQLLAWHTEIAPAAEELERLALESYREGRSSILAVLDAERSHREVELELLQAQFGFQMAVAALEEAGGVAIP